MTDDSETIVPLKRIAKPTSVFERFKSKKPPTIGGVDRLVTALPVMRINEVGDFVSFHRRKNMDP